RIPRRGGAVVTVRPQTLPCLVDEHRLRIAEDGCRLAVEAVGAPLEELRRADIVVGRPLEVWSPRELDHTIVIPGRAPVPVAPMVDDAWVPPRVLAADRLGAIGRRVVGDDQLEVGARLAQQRVQRGLEIALAVVDRQTDDDPRDQQGLSTSRIAANGTLSRKRASFASCRLIPT